MKKSIIILALVTNMCIYTSAATVTAELNGDTITYNGDVYIKSSNNELPKVSDVDWEITDPTKKLQEEFKLAYSLKVASTYEDSEKNRNLALEPYRAYCYYRDTLGVSTEYIFNGNIMYIEWNEVADTTRHLGEGILVMQDGKSLPLYYNKSDYSDNIKILKGTTLNNKRFLFYNKKGGKIQIYNSYTNELVKELTPINEVAK